MQQLCHLYDPDVLDAQFGSIYVWETECIRVIVLVFVDDLMCPSLQKDQVAQGWTGQGLQGL